MKDTLDKRIDFVNELEKLKSVKRGNLTLDDGRAENSAEHSWHTAVLAMVLLSNAKPLVRLKILEMLLIHDTAEIYAGDTFFYDDSEKKEAFIRERLAMEKLCALLPEEDAERIEELWFEFETGDTAEARTARALDALQPLLSHAVTAPDNYNPYQLKADLVRGKKICIKEALPAIWPAAEKAIRESIKRGLYT